jgi:homospermidine synthase
MEKPWRKPKQFNTVFATWSTDGFIALGRKWQPVEESTAPNDNCGHTASQRQQYKSGLFKEYKSGATITNGW